MNRTIATLGRLGVVGLTMLTALLATTRSASAFINPHFTPKDLLKQSDSAIVVEITSVDKDGMATATVKEVLKADPNKPAPKELKIDLLAMGEALSAQGKEVMSWAAGGAKLAILFSGVFDTGGDSGGGNEGQAAGPKPMGFLNFAGKWLVVNQDDKGVWEMEKIWEYLLGTWAGNTDMLLECMKCIVKDPDFDVPVAAGVEWDANGIVRFTKVPGKVVAVAPVDLLGKGQADVFLAADSGDHLFRYDGKAMQDLTAKLGIASKSAAFAWGDFDGDGKLDLASWDGKALTIFSQKADGSFAGKACELGEAFKDGCLSLAAVDVGAQGKAGLLAGTSGWPVLLVPQAGGAMQAKPLGTGEFPGKALGQPGVCLVADLDGDGIPDVLQVFAEGSLFYKSPAPGAFAAPARTQVAVGTGRYGICLADFQGHGLQDVLIVGDARNRIYQNLGGGKFVDMLGYSGSLAYISKNGGVVADSGDFNNDGRQDLFIAYGTKMAPHLFFNRGFRCFGQARDLDLVEQKGALEAVDKTLVTDASEPQQAGCLGDFNGDGALDLVLVLGNGDVVFFPRKVNADIGALGVIASLPPGGPTAGPVLVSASKDDRDLGTWVIRQGGPAAIIGTKAGPVTLKWTTPDGKSKEQKVKVKDAPVRVTLGKE